MQKRFFLSFGIGLCSCFLVVPAFAEVPTRMQPAELIPTQGPSHGPSDSASTAASFSTRPVANPGNFVVAWPKGNGFDFSGELVDRFDTVAPIEAYAQALNPLYQAPNLVSDAYAGHAGMPGHLLNPTNPGGIPIRQLNDKIQSDPEIKEMLNASWGLVGHLGQHVTGATDHTAGYVKYAQYKVSDVASRLEKLVKERDALDEIAQAPIKKRIEVSRTIVGQTPPEYYQYFKALEKYGNDIRRSQAPRLAQLRDQIQMLNIKKDIADRLSDNASQASAMRKIFQAQQRIPNRLKPGREFDPRFLISTQLDYNLSRSQEAYKKREDFNPRIKIEHNKVFMGMSVDEALKAQRAGWRAALQN